MKSVSAAAVEATGVFEAGKIGLERIARGGGGGDGRGGRGRFLIVAISLLRT